MKQMIKPTSLFIFFIVVLSCAASAQAIPEKYNLGSDFEAVDRITTFSIRSYENIDKQSLILETTYNEYYLLVLERPRLEIAFGKTGFDYQGATLAVGQDRVVMDYDTGPQYYFIEKIYKLKGREQVTEIKKLLPKEEK